MVRRAYTQRSPFEMLLPGGGHRWPREIASGPDGPLGLAFHEAPARGSR
jgi:hypothetical protein